jgi:NitT/TauT family transport system substrate-binding protein
MTGWRAIFLPAARLIAVAAALLGGGGTLAAQDKLTARIAIGGPSCICYLPTVLANQLGYYKQAGVEVELIALKGGSEALTAVLGGSADVVSGYYEHTVRLAAKGKALQSVVVYDQFPGLVLMVSPKHTDSVKSVADLVGKTVGVSAPGSATDYFLKYLLFKAGKDPKSAATVGVGLGATAVAAMEQGQIHAAVSLDPVVTMLQGKHPTMRILADTRSAADTRATFGGDYPGGSLYAPVEWVQKNPKAAQALVDAMLMTLNWIHSHSAEEIAAKMPAEYKGEDAALYLAALKNSLPMFSKTGLMDAKGAQAVHDVFAQFEADVAAAKLDVRNTYTNAFAEAAAKKIGGKY